MATGARAAPLARSVSDNGNLRPLPQAEDQMSMWIGGKGEPIISGLLTHRQFSLDSPCLKIGRVIVGTTFSKS